MADASDKNEENVSGSFYVDSQCIDCDMCRDSAPSFFKRSVENGYSYVYNQPSTEEDRTICEQALAECPVDAIGADGD